MRSSIGSQHFPAGPEAPEAGDGPPDDASIVSNLAAMYQSSQLAPKPFQLLGIITIARSTTSPGGIRLEGYLLMDFRGGPSRFRFQRTFLLRRFGVRMLRSGRQRRVLRRILKTPHLGFEFGNSPVLFDNLNHRQVDDDLRFGRLPGDEFFRDLQ